MGPVPLFVELCAGTAALSLRLHARGARPPVSRMGAKTGYADCILRVLGLAPGARAAHYLWCEPDPGVRLLLEAYRDADLARAAAAIIRSWADEEPRALWERLRAEGPPRLPPTGAEVARWQVVLGSMWVHKQDWRPLTAWAWCEDKPNPPEHADRLDALPTLPATIAPDARTVDPREVARWVVTGQWAYRPGQPESGFAACRAYERIGPDGYPRMDFDIPTVTARFDAAPTLPATIHPDARTVDPREVARWAWVQGRGYHGARWGCTFLPVEHPVRGTNGTAPELTAERLDTYGAMPATIAPDAREVHPPALPPGTVCYMDPPYVGTTGYASDLPRSEVVTLARRWQAAGARVCISEAEPIPELVADGWHAVRIDGERQGQKRTFSRQQAEWLTLSETPAWRPSVQAGLFA